MWNHSSYASERREQDQFPKRQGIPPQWNQTAIKCHLNTATQLKRVLGGSADFEAQLNERIIITFLENNIVSVPFAYNTYDIVQ